MPQPLDELAREFRAAVLAGDHTLAGRLASEYAQALSHVWEALGEPERAASPLPAQANELLTWAREMTVVQRAMTAEHVAILDKAIRYQGGGARPGSSLEVSL